LKFFDDAADVIGAQNQLPPKRTTRNSHMTNASRPLVLVTGTTGKQGCATVAKLLASGKTHIRALTRDPASPKTQNLAKQGVELICGDFDDSSAVRAALNGVSTAFSVQIFEGKGGLEAEERQGIPLYPGKAFM
jgi:NmrA-like family